MFRIVLLLFAVTSVFQCGEVKNFEKEFESNQLIPSVISETPEKQLQVKYKEGKEAELGNELTPKQVLDAPEIKYEADPKDYYTLIFTDPDAGSEKNPEGREWNHWMVVNIPGSKISEGEVITDYVGSAPPKGSGLHRYLFLLYKQPEKLKVDEPRHGPTDGNRGSFSAEKFAKKYNLGRAVAGNFFKAQYDDSVPASHKKLGL